MSSNDLKQMKLDDISSVAKAVKADAVVNDRSDEFMKRVLVGIASFILLSFWLFFARQSDKTGWDFPVFYTAASLPAGAVYSREAFASFWLHNLAPLGVPHWARFVRLPVFSLVLTPISVLPYGRALWLWMALGLTAYFASVWMLVRRFRLPGLLVPLFVAFFPAMLGWISGQDNCYLLLGVIGGLLLLERGRDALAGLVFALCLYKYNLVILVPLMLLLQRRYKAATFLAAGATAIVGASFAITPVRTYLTTLSEVPRETPGFFPVGLKGFSIAVEQPWCFPALAVAVVLLCCLLIRRLPLIEAFCVAVTGGLMIVPYVCWYDSTLLVLPLSVIYARASFPVRFACAVILAAVPAWLHGGGNNGPIGFTHIVVEMFILAYFVFAAHPENVRRALSRIEENSAESARRLAACDAPCSA